METTIKLNVLLKKKLDSLKIHPRESYNDVIARFLGGMKRIDEEGLIETVELLSDSESIRDIAEALDDYEKGRFVELK